MKENIIMQKSFDFSVKIAGLVTFLRKRKEFIIADQLLRSASNIGVNVTEASAALTRKEFILKMSIASKEARESSYWIRLLDKSQLIEYDYTSYISDIDEIIKITTAIIKKAQINLNSLNTKH